MLPQITKRQIGNVTIIDIKGPLTGVWALREKASGMKNLVSEEAQAVILNIQGMTQLDTVGAKAIFESVPKNKHIGFFGGSEDVLEVLQHFEESKKFRLFHDEEEIVSAFGKDLVKFQETNEKRRCERLSTALPLGFYFEEEGEKISFHAIVTNLSKTGLFAEYIDLKVAEQSLEQLNPYDLKMLHLTISLPKGKKIEADGKVMHRKMDGDQVGIGIEFYKISPEAQKEIERFLKASSDLYQS